MHALIDGDIFLYEFGSSRNDSGEPLGWPLVVSRMDARIENILEAVGATSSQIYLSGQGNFRTKVSTILPYKGNRPSEKPYWHGRLFDFLVSFRDAVVISGMEADDAVGMAQFTASNETVICSRDKDLHMIPGWHYTWSAGKQKEQPLWWQDEINALRCFYRQLLTGDSVDNILGIYGMGKSSSIVARIAEFSSEQGMYDLVKAEYVKRFGSYWKLFMYENAQLLWILREGDVNEVHNRFERLENETS